MGSVVLVLLSLLSHTHSSAWSGQELPTQIQRISDQIRIETQQLKSTYDQHQACQSDLDSIQTLERVITRIQPTRADLSWLKTNGLKLIANLSQIRLGVRSVLASAQVLEQEECRDKILSFYGSIRSLEDWIAVQWQYVHRIKAANTFADPKTTFYNPRFRGTRFRSGDVLMFRNDSIISAAIAKTGNYPGEFSHVAIVHVEKSVPHLVESMPTTGLRVIPVYTVFAEGHNLRALWLRPKDAQAGRKASRFIYGIAKGRKKVSYDFNLDEGFDRLACTEVVEYAYQHGAPGTIVPGRYFKNSLSQLGTEFTRMMGFRMGEKIMTPSDAELDPEFEWVGEWRNFPRMNEVLESDAIIGKLYTWVKQRGYRVYSDPFGSRLVDALIRGRDLKTEKLGVKNPLLDFLSRDVDRSFALGLIQLFRTALGIERGLKEYITQHRSFSFQGRQPTLDELNRGVEVIRTADWVSYETQVSSFPTSFTELRLIPIRITMDALAVTPFHRVFRPIDLRQH